MRPDSLLLCLRASAPASVPDANRDRPARARTAQAHQHGPALRPDGRRDVASAGRHARAGLRSVAAGRSGVEWRLLFPREEGSRSSTAGSRRAAASASSCSTAAGTNALPRIDGCRSSQLPRVAAAGAAVVLDRAGAATAKERSTFDAAVQVLEMRKGPGGGASGGVRRVTARMLHLKGKLRSRDSRGVGSYLSSSATFFMNAKDFFIPGTGSFASISYSRLT